MTLVVALLALVTGALGTRSASFAGDPQDERREILGLIGPRAGETICDLGCGEGTWTFELARAVGMHGRVFAVDIDRRRLDKLRAKQEREGLENIKVVQSQPDNPMLPKNEMDAVFLNDVIDVVERRALAGFLAGIRASLKPSGRLIIRDPNGDPARVIAECYRAGFSLAEAKIPLKTATAKSFANDWYALKLRVAERPPHALLPRLGQPARYRTRLHLAEELFRDGLLSRDELRARWEAIQNTGGSFDPAIDEARDLIRAAESLSVVESTLAKILNERLAKRKKPAK